MKVLVDTNVLLDVLGKREPFYPDAARIWSLAERGEIEALVSAISFNNIYYVIRKAAGKKSADKALRALRDIFTPIALDARLINQSMDAPIDDFEDSVQFHSASRSGADYFITRDTAGFPSTGIPILSPREFLAILDVSREGTPD